LRWVDFQASQVSFGRVGRPVSWQELLVMVGVFAVGGVLVLGGLFGAVVGAAFVALAEAWFQGVYVTKRALRSGPHLSDRALWPLYLAVNVLIVPAVLVGIFSALRNLLSTLRAASEKRI
jgi:hypothetical protein